MSSMSHAFSQCSLSCLVGVLITLHGMCLQVRAGVRQKVAAALEQVEALEAKIDAKQAEYNRAVAAASEDKAAQQQKLAEAQIAQHSLGMDLQAAQQKAARQALVVLMLSWPRLHPSGPIKGTGR
jgi:hypothetical protein